MIAFIHRNYCMKDFMVSLPFGTINERVHSVLRILLRLLRMNQHSDQANSGNGLPRDCSNGASGDVRYRLDEGNLPNLIRLYISIYIYEESNECCV